MPSGVRASTSKSVSLFADDLPPALKHHRVFVVANHEVAPVGVITSNKTSLQKLDLESAPVAVALKAIGARRGRNKLGDRSLAVLVRLNLPSGLLRSVLA